jgi:hypothetical protein
LPARAIFFSKNEARMRKFFAKTKKIKEKRKKTKKNVDIV